MRTLLGQRDAATLGGDQVFLAARRALEQKLATVVATTEARFDEPWDVIAMDAAAARRGTLEGVIVSSRFAARYAEAEDTLPAAGPSRSIRGATRGPT